MQDEQSNPDLGGGQSVFPQPTGFQNAPANNFSAPIAEAPKPTPMPVDPPVLNSSGVQPVAVVKVLSVRGVEYLFMSILLWVGAGSLIVLILSIVNGQTGFDTLAFPLALLLVGLPGFAWLFLRLKKAELADPSLKLDPSKRRSTQRTQVLAFVVCLINLITYVYLVLQSFGGDSDANIGKSTLNTAVILLVAGGVLAYYWVDEHRQGK